MEGKLDGSEDHEGGQGFGEIFEVLCETPVLSELGEGALDHPAARQDDEALHVIAPLDHRLAQPRGRRFGQVPEYDNDLKK